MGTLGFDSYITHPNFKSAITSLFAASIGYIENLTECFPVQEYSQSNTP